MLIKLYVYKISDGKLLYEYVGEPSYTLKDISPDNDFTLTPPPDYDHVWRWIDAQWLADAPIEPPIEELQAQVWGSIKSTRLSQITNGVLVESVNKTFHTDSMSAIQYSTIAGMAAMGTYEPVNWKVLDNSWVLLTVELLKELQVAISVKTNTNHKVAEQHKAAMLLVDNPLEYDYSTNWI